MNHLLELDFPVRFQPLLIVLLFDAGLNARLVADLHHSSHLPKLNNNNNLNNCLQKLQMIKANPSIKLDFLLNICFILGFLSGGLYYWVIIQCLMIIVVKVVDALLSHDTQLFSNMDPYFFVQVGSQRYRSRTCKDGGKRPVWNERFEFTSTDNTLKITVMDEDTFNDDLVGEGTLNLSKFRTSLPEQDQILQLYYTNRTAGKIKLRVSSSNPGQNFWGNQNGIPQTNPSIQPQSNWGQNQQWNPPQQNPWGVQPQNQWNQSPPQIAAYNSYGSQRNVGYQSPWGDLSQNNGWGSFAPTNPNSNFNSSPNIPMNNNPNINPLQVLGGIFGNTGINPNPGSNSNPYKVNPYQ